MIHAKDGEVTEPEPDDAYETALFRAGALHRQLYAATVRQDQAERDRLTREHAAAVDAVCVLRAREAKQWARGFRFYRTDHEGQLLFHLREVFEDVLRAVESRIDRRLSGLAQLAQRVDELEDVVAESALAIPQEGGATWSA